jgi:hypothetical protein
VVVGLPLRSDHALGRRRLAALPRALRGPALPTSARVRPGVASGRLGENDRANQRSRRRRGTAQPAPYGHPRRRAAGAARAAARARPSRRPVRLRPLRRRLHPVLHRVLVPLERTTGDLRRKRRRRVRRVRPGVRGGAHACRDRLRAHRDVSGVPGDRAPDADPRTRPGRSRDQGGAGRRPGRLPRHPRLQGAVVQRCGGCLGRSAGRRHRGDDGAQESERDRAHSRERALVRARTPAAAGVHAARGHRSRGEYSGWPRGDARNARGARRLLWRRALVLRRCFGRLSGTDRVAQLVGARGRPQHRVSGRRRARDRNERADLGLQTRSSNER